MNDIRPSWDTYFMDLAFNVAQRSTCPRASVGAIITLNNRILGTGYNGSPSGTPHCTDAGCFLVGGHCIRSIHAEANAILDALQRGPIRGATAYCTHRPCVRCLQLLRQTGVERIVYGLGYPVPRNEMELWQSLDIPSIVEYTPE